jgi:hypothetical protein
MLQFRSLPTFWWNGGLSDIRTGSTKTFPSDHDNRFRTTFGPWHSCGPERIPSLFEVDWRLFRQRSRSRYLNRANGPQLGAVRQRPEKVRTGLRGCLRLNLGPKASVYCHLRSSGRSSSSRAPRLLVVAVRLARGLQAIITSIHFFASSSPWPWPWRALRAFAGCFLLAVRPG